jgi:hypothetical protein
VSKTVLSQIFLLFLAVALVIRTVPEINAFHRTSQREGFSDLSHLPSRALKALSFGFDGVMADFLMLKVMTVTGEKLINRETFSPEDYRLMTRSFDTVTDIDSRFWDPYLLAETMLTWQGGMIEEANRLLLKAAENRPLDYRPYYFLGFNHFYFLKQDEKACEYMSEAAKRPGAPFYLKGLAARFSLYGGHTETGIIFLQGMLRETTDPRIREYLQERIESLKKIHFLEKEVLAYRDQFGTFPSSIEKLVEKGLIPGIPEDPYGGKFILLENGRVYTTSKLVENKKREK